MVVALAIGGGWLVSGGTRDNVVAAVPLSNEGLSPLGSDSSGKAKIVERGASFLLRLDVTRPPQEPESYIEVWLIDSQVKGMVSLGPFRGNGDYPIPSSVDPAKYPIVDISIEPSDGVPDAQRGQHLARGRCPLNRSAATAPELLHPPSARCGVLKDMARYVVTVLTPRTPHDAFAYMADLRNFAEWDPGVKRVTQVAGSGGGPDAAFDVVVASGRGELNLRYVTTQYDEPRLVLIEARSRMLTSIDRITVTGSAVAAASPTTPSSRSTARFDCRLRTEAVLQAHRRPRRAGPRRPPSPARSSPRERGGRSSIR